jgi:hypothetical protein
LAFLAPYLMNPYTREELLIDSIDNHIVEEVELFLQK